MGCPVSLAEAPITRRVKVTVSSVLTSAQELNLYAGSGVTFTTSEALGVVSLTISSSGGGSSDHATLTHLDYASSGHTGFVPATRTVSAGTGLTGGGALSADRTLALDVSGVTAASKGSATRAVTVTVDAYGRATALSDVLITPAWSSLTGTPTTLSGYGITDAITYAPGYAASAAPSGYQWASLGRRLELAPATSSFPSLNLLTAGLPGTTRRNSSLWTSATCSGGTLAAVVKTGASDFSSAGHGCPTILDRTAINGGRSFIFTAHVSGSITATNTNGIGIGFWDAITNSRTGRIAVYYVAGAIKVYYGYGATESSTAITAGNLTTGVWLQIEIDTAGTLYLRYQVAALATTPPTSSWTTPYTVTDYVHTASGARWPTWNYSVHAYNNTGADRTCPTLDGLWDTTASGANPIRTPADGAGVGVSSASPAVTLLTDVPYTAATCDQTALRAWAAKVAAPASALETATVEFLVRSTATPGSYSGSTWYAASAIVAPSSSTYLEVQARVVSDGITLGSLDVGAVSALRVK